MKQPFHLLNYCCVIQKRKKTNKVIPGGSLLAQRGGTRGNHGSISELRKLVYNLGRLRWLEFMGMCTGEEGANQGKAQKSAKESP